MNSAYFTNVFCRGSFHAYPVPVKGFSEGRGLLCITVRPTAPSCVGEMLLLRVGLPSHPGMSVESYRLTLYYVLTCLSAETAAPAGQRRHRIPLQDPLMFSAGGVLKNKICDINYALLRWHCVHALQWNWRIGKYPANVAIIVCVSRGSSQGLCNYPINLQIFKNKLLSQNG